MGPALTAFMGLIVIYIAFGIQNPTVFSTANVMNLLRSMSIYLLVGIGQSYVLITGNIDLSIGSTVGMSAMISATLMSNGVPIAATVPVTLVCCLLVGATNGTLVGKFKLPPFIATLGTMFVARGVAYMVNGNRNTNAISSGIGKESADRWQDLLYYGRSPLFYNLFLGTFALFFLIYLISYGRTHGVRKTLFVAAVPFAIFCLLFYFGSTFIIFNTTLIALTLFAVFFFLLSKTRTGRHIYAIGSNIDAAKLSGVNVQLTITKAYLVSSFCSFVVGVILCAQAGMGNMEAGVMYEMYGVAAGVIGGISPLGGTGILLGTLAGAAVWQTLENGLSMIGARVGIQRVVIGVIVVFAVLLDVVLRNRRSIINLKQKNNV